MKLNKKGMTLVELIISVALLSVVLGFMFKLLLDVKYEHDNAGFAIKNQVNRAEIIKTIQNDFEDLGLLSYTYSRENQNIIFNFNKESKTLKIEGNKITYGDRKWTITDEGYKFGDITVDEINSEYVSIVIPVLNGEEDTTDIDNIMLVTKYKTIDNPYLKDAVIADAKNNDYLSSTAPDFNVKTKDGEYGLYKAADDYGISYYFRGDVENNYVKFGTYASGTTVNGVTYSKETPMYWRIVRVNGDGSVRLIYDGTSLVDNNTEHTGVIGLTYYGEKANNADYLTSNVKNVVDDWYENNLLPFNGYIANTSFCNDTILSDFQYYNSNYKDYRYLYEPFKRLADGDPQLTCSGTSLMVANNELDYPVGLITAEEAAMAGGMYVQDYDSGNDEVFYLYNYKTQNLTMSAADRTTDVSKEPWTLGIGVVGVAGALYGIVIEDSNAGVRPVINLKARVKVSSGDGTISAPYEVEL